MKTENHVPSSGPDGLEVMKRVLAESVPLARHWAGERCWRDPVSGESCAWYHGAWQTLRLLGIVSTLTHHAPLYLEALRPLITDGDHKRVFLSGSADYGLLSVVLDAFAQEDLRPEITVADRCETPLRLCRWYAERCGFALETVQADLGEVPLDRPFDLICVHSLLSCIPVERHGEIVATWRRLLRPGGILMMANTLYLGTPGKAARFSPQHVEDYKTRVFKAAAGCPHPEALPPADELERIAEAFSSTMAASVISSRAQLSDLLVEGGFEILDERFGEFIKDPNYQRTGPPVTSKKEHAWVVARRV